MGRFSLFQSTLSNLKSYFYQFDYICQWALLIFDISTNQFIYMGWMLNSEPIHAEKPMAIIPQIATRKLPLSIDVPAK